MCHHVQLRSADHHAVLLQLVDNHREVIGSIIYSAAAHHTEQSHKVMTETLPEAYKADVQAQTKTAPTRQHSGLDRRPSATRQVPAIEADTAEACGALESSASQATHGDDWEHAQMVHAPSLTGERQLYQQEGLKDSAAVHGQTSQESEAFIYSSTGRKDWKAPH